MEQEEADFSPAMVLGVIGTLDAVPCVERQDPLNLSSLRT